MVRGIVGATLNQCIILARQTPSRKRLHHVESVCATWKITHRDSPGCAPFSERVKFGQEIDKDPPSTAILSVSARGRPSMWSGSVVVAHT